MLARMPITDEAALLALYGRIPSASVVKEIDHLTPRYAAFVRAAPMVMLATAGPGGLDVTPRGDPAGVVDVVDPRRLILPDRRGNNRLDSLRNIIADPRVGLLFIVPGAGETLRVNGRATIHAEPERLARYAVDGHLPATLLEIAVDTVFFHCARAFHRSRLWEPSTWPARAAVPSAGDMLAEASAGA